MTTFQAAALEGQLQGYLDHLAIERAWPPTPLRPTAAICAATPST